MSWQAPQRLTKVCLLGPSGKSACACCALTGGAAHSRAAAIRAKSGVLDMAFSRNGCASLPQFLRSEPRALGERGELHPHDLGVDLQPAGEGAEAAIDAGDDVLGSTTRAYCTMRSATSSGCSTKFKVESITPGM